MLRGLVRIRKVPPYVCLNCAESHRVLRILSIFDLSPQPSYVFHVPWFLQPRTVTVFLLLCTCARLASPCFDLDFQPTRYLFSTEVNNQMHFALMLRCRLSFGLLSATRICTLHLFYTIRAKNSHHLQPIAIEAGVDCLPVLDTRLQSWPDMKTCLCMVSCKCVVRSDTISTRLALTR